MNLYWRVSYLALAAYLNAWTVPAHFYGAVFGRRVFIGVLVGGKPESDKAIDR